MCVSDAKRSSASSTSISITPRGNGDLTSTNVSKGTSGRALTAARLGRTKLSVRTCTKVLFIKFTVCFRINSGSFMSLAMSMCKCGRSMKNTCRFPNKGSRPINGQKRQDTVPIMDAPVTVKPEISTFTPAGPWNFSSGFTQNSGPASHCMSASTCKPSMPFKLRLLGRTLVMRGGTLPGSKSTCISSMLISGMSCAATLTASKIFSVPLRIINARACGQKMPIVKFSHSTSLHFSANSDNWLIPVSAKTPDLVPSLSDCLSALSAWSASKSCTLRMEGSFHVSWNELLTYSDVNDSSSFVCLLALESQHSPLSGMHWKPLDDMSLSPVTATRSSPSLASVRSWHPTAELPISVNTSQRLRS
mmetsp:Transcript_29473/g.67906  ORF Transcript_29473/g.67906 Transcript_29473/m.67906 type:complete len:362 (-) Transcript_29473:2-1087(-)